MTRDGTGERDYIHELDLAEGHMAAILYLKNHDRFSCVNLCSGKPLSAMYLLNTFEIVIWGNFKKEAVQRSSRDLPYYYTSVEQASIKLNWGANRSIEVACRDLWKLQRGKNFQ